MLKLGCALKQANKKTQKISVLWAEAEPFNHLSPQCNMHRDCLYLFNISRPDSVPSGEQRKARNETGRCQVKEERYLWRGGSHCRKQLPLLPGEALELMADLWHWRRMGYTCLQSREGQIPTTHPLVPTPLSHRSYVQLAVRRIAKAFNWFSSHMGLHWDWERQKGSMQHTAEAEV